jgi:hypothetical protein
VSAPIIMEWSTTLSVIRVNRTLKKIFKMVSEGLWGVVS